MRQFMLMAAVLIAGPVVAQEKMSPEKAAAEIPVAILDELKPMAFMAGACWEGPMPDGKQIAAHCVRAFMRGRYIRDRFELKGSTPPYGGETTYYWDHDAKAVKYIYWANDGGMSTGTMKADGTALVFDDERYIGKDGEMRVRGRITPIDADSFRWQSEIQGQDGKWMPMLDSVFTRKPINWGPY
jgi:hypothetical protein